MGNFDNSIAKIEKAIRYMQNDAKVIMGVEATNHFKESFKNQGFTDKSLEKWEEVERRKPTSPWRGFSYGSNIPKPGRKQRKEGAISNYSPAAEARPILVGPTQQLLNSIKWEKTANGVRIYATTEYSKLMNEGGTVKVFGRSSKNIPRRQFMGKSEVLRKRITSMIMLDLQNILK